MVHPLVTRNWRVTMYLKIKFKEFFKNSSHPYVIVSLTGIIILIILGIVMAIMHRAKRRQEEQDDRRNSLHLLEEGRFTPETFRPLPMTPHEEDAAPSPVLKIEKPDHDKEPPNDEHRFGPFQQDEDEDGDMVNNDTRVDQQKDNGGKDSKQNDNGGKDSNQNDDGGKDSNQKDFGTTISR